MQSKSLICLQHKGNKKIPHVRRADIFLSCLQQNLPILLLHIAAHNVPFVPQCYVCMNLTLYLYTGARGEIYTDMLRVQIRRQSRFLYIEYTAWALAHIQYIANAHT
ncbi:hypothetical protein GDO81_008301 [Engystomops pustulosus]|uniref:Uncharacterized protein n=1 Tax=Engystomops pustulosus TaxID=76066 RepID=A0AAV7CEK0_ENGPU|nr:hypothetical protein GDO81_008301 [Engystomops pustulosus]